jgi:hypothetical protein
LAVVTPYEFTVHCFTPELAAVLEGLYSNPHCLMVKNVIVDQAASDLLGKEAPVEGAAPMASAVPSMNYGAMQMMMMRYGMSPGSMMRYGMPMVTAPVAPVAAAPRGPTQVLGEKPFRAILWVDVLRFRDPNEAKAARSSRSPRGPRAPADDSAPAPGDTAADASQPSTPTSPGN